MIAAKTQDRSGKYLKLVSSILFLLLWFQVKPAHSEDLSIESVGTITVDDTEYDISEVQGKPFKKLRKKQADYRDNPWYGNIDLAMKFGFAYLKAIEVETALLAFQGNTSTTPEVGCTPPFIYDKFSDPNDWLDALTSYRGVSTCVSNKPMRQDLLSSYARIRWREYLYEAPQVLSSQDQRRHVIKLLLAPKYPVENPIPFVLEPEE